MMKKLMLGASITALMLGGAFAQSSTAPGSNNQSNPPAAAPAKPGVDQPATNMNKEPAAEPASSAENKSDKAKTDNQAAANSGNEAAGGKPKVVASQGPDEFLASNLNGTDVIGSNGEKIGNVADILFEKDGTIKAYVISFGGFLGMGAKEVAIAPSAFEVMPGKNGEAKKLKLSMSQNDLKSAQKFTEYTPPKPATTTTGSGGGSMGGTPMGASPPSSGTTPSGR